MVFPPSGTIKVNVDASLVVDGWVGLGVLARDSVGEVLFPTTRRVRTHWSAEVAEAKGIEMVVRLRRRYELQNVIIESDCQTVINRLSKQAIFLSDLNIVLHSIFTSSEFFYSINWSHVKQLSLEVAPYIMMDKLSME